MGAAGVYGFASPLHIMEEGKRQDLIGNHGLLIEVICPHPPEHMEQLIQCIQQHFGVCPLTHLVTGPECLMLQHRCIEVWDVL